MSKEKKSRFWPEKLQRWNCCQLRGKRLQEDQVCGECWDLELGIPSLKWLLDTWWEMSSWLLLMHMWGLWEYMACVWVKDGVTSIMALKVVRLNEIVKWRRDWEWVTIQAEKLGVDGVLKSQETEMYQLEGSKNRVKCCREVKWDENSKLTVEVHSWRTVTRTCLVEQWWLKSTLSSIRENGKRRIGMVKKDDFWSSCQRKQGNGWEAGEESGVQLRVCWWCWCLCLWGIGIITNMVVCCWKWSSKEGQINVLGKIEGVP